MSTNIGADTRAKQIGKWKEAIAKNVDLLVAFPSQPIDDDLQAEFRGAVAERIKSLADYLTTGQWGLFDGQPLTPPPAKAERDAKAKAKKNAAAVDNIVEGVSESPLALPEPKCVHLLFGNGETLCGHPESHIVNCDGCRRECSFFELSSDEAPAAEATKGAKKSTKKSKKKGAKK